MKISATAKQLLSISALAVLMGPLYDLECGTYLLRGKLSSDTLGRFVLTLNAGSSSPTELLLLGGSVQERSKRSNSETVVRVYVPQAIHGGAVRPFVYTQNFAASAEIGSAVVIREKQEPCGDRSRFMADRSEKIRAK